MATKETKATRATKVARATKATRATNSAKAGTAKKSAIKKNGSAKTSRAAAQRSAQKRSMKGANAPSAPKGSAIKTTRSTKASRAKTTPGKSGAIRGALSQTRTSQTRTGKRSQGSKVAKAENETVKKSGALKKPKNGIYISPNAITIIRIILAFAWLALFELLVEPPSVVALQITRFASFSTPILIFAAAFLLIALTDLLDGYCARKKNKISNFGIFLDPIADKILVLCGLLLLMQYGYVNIWVIVIIVSREFLVAGMRMCVAEKGVVVGANGLGKAKTAITILAILGFLVYMALPPLLLATIVLFWVSQFLLLFAIFFTIWSGLEYYVECKHYL